MNSVPRISVLLPIYNDAEFVPQAMDCILAQSFGDFELLATDDGSTDDTLEILKDYAKRDSRVVVHSRENRGLVFTLNEAIERARAPYLARMDADDWSHPERFARQIEFLEANPDVGVVGCSVSVIEHTGFRYEYPYPETDAANRVLMYFQPPFCHSVVMYRRSVLDEHDIRYSEDFKHAEDYDIYERISRVSKLANLPEILHRVSSRPDSVSETNQEVSRRNRIRVIRRIFDAAGIEAADADLEAAMGYRYGRRELDRAVRLFDRMVRGVSDEDKAAMGDSLMRRFVLLIVTRYGMIGFRRYMNSEVRRVGSPGRAADLKLMLRAAERTMKNAIRGHRLEDSQG